MKFWKFNITSIYLGNIFEILLNLAVSDVQKVTERDFFPSLLVSGNAVLVNVLLFIRNLFVDVEFSIDFFQI